MTPEHDWILGAAQAGAPLADLREAAAAFEAAGALEDAAAALDQAHMIAPEDEALSVWRKRVLTSVSVELHGMLFRYIPDGAFWMGAEDGDPDERPVHSRRAGGVWLGEVPVSWTAYCELMGWSPPPDGAPDDDNSDRDVLFQRSHQNTLRQLYCARETRRTPGLVRAVPSPEDFAAKPMVAVTLEEAEALAERLSGGDWLFRLPTEAEWEKAARGGLVGKRFAWGDAPPTPDVCCCGVFSSFAMAPSADIAPNGYGLRAMCGTVWELTADNYDALAYDNGGQIGPRADDRVIRGGSWADSPAAATVSFRATLAAGRWRNPLTPTIGFRLCAEWVG